MVRSIPLALTFAHNRRLAQVVEHGLTAEFPVVMTLELVLPGKLLVNALFTATLKGKMILTLFRTAKMILPLRQSEVHGLCSAG